MLRLVRHPTRSQARPERTATAASVAATLEPEAVPEGALGTAFRAQRARALAAILPKTMMIYEKLAQDFLEHCEGQRFPKPEPREPLCKVAVADFLWKRSERAKNARSWKLWQSKLHVYFSKKWRCPPFSPETVAYLLEQKRACQKEVGVVETDVEPITADRLRQIFKAGRAAMETDIRLKQTYRQLVVAHKLTLRPEDLYLTGAGVPADRVVAGDITFVDPQPGAGLPLGSVRVVVRNSKGAKQTGASKIAGELHEAGATGDELCPVAAIKGLMLDYGLFDPNRAGEPLVAAMSASGQRVYARPEVWLGARLLSGKEFNERVETLCSLAGLPRATGKGTRHGWSSDALAACIPERVSNTMGHWAEGSQHPYQRVTSTLAGSVLTATVLAEERLRQANEILRTRSSQQHGETPRHL